MNKKKVLLLASCLMCLCLSGCFRSNQSDVIDDEPFGFSESNSEANSKAEPSQESVYGFETRIDTSEQSIESKAFEAKTSEAIETKEDKFSISYEIDMESGKKSEEELSVEMAESEAEPFLYENIDGSEKDIRDEAGYQGLLKFVNSYKNYGGIEAIADTPRAEIQNHLESTYFLATSKEIEDILSIIYEGSEEEKQQLEADALHTEEGFVYTDEGWKNVYEETNSERERKSISE